MTDKLRDIAGVTFGVRIQGRLPAEFRRYLWPLGVELHHDKPMLDVGYRNVDVLPEVKEIWVGQYSSSRMSSRFSLFRESCGYGLKVQCQGRGVFHITPSKIRIEWMANGTGAAHYFFAHALPLWLELNGYPVLHASAVSFGDDAVAFAGSTGMGKSTLCHGLVGLEAGFIADDGLPLIDDERGKWLCSPGPPLLRLWPTALSQHPQIRVRELARVHDVAEKRVLPLDEYGPGELLNHGARLRAVYILERQVDAVEETRIVPIVAREALIRLVEFSLAGAPAGAMGLEGLRLAKLARVAETVEVKRLIYPSGGDYLMSIRDEILADIRQPQRDPAE